MRHLKSILSLAAVLLILGACGGTAPTAAPTAAPAEPADVEPAPARLVISEVLTGVEGDNRVDFIELYNAGDEPADLQGLALFYQLNDDAEEVLLRRWNTTTLVPPRGYYLLGQQEQDIGAAVDATFDQSLVATRGGLALREVGAETAVDALVWGTGPAALAEGDPAPAADAGLTIERKPGGEEGAATDTDDNRADFAISDNPSPQNSGNSTAPSDLRFGVEVPVLVQPGSEFEIRLDVGNEGDQPLEDVRVLLALPEELTVVEGFVGWEGLTIDDGSVRWEIDQLAAGDSRSGLLLVTAPWTFTQLSLPNTRAEAPGTLAAFGGPLHLEVGGGSIPIATARELEGQEVVVEGTATMYTGGFYAGSGAKFYMEDETAGIQVYVAGAGGQLNVPMDAPVRVQGRVEPYRGALELVPAGMEDVEILDQPHREWSPSPVSISEAANDLERLPGRLVQVEGIIARVEEFSFSYEVDIVDDEGQLVTAYVDKDTGVSVEGVESGDRYQVTGIIEIRDGRQQLNPRVQSDFLKVYPPVLRVEARAPSSVEPGDPFPVTVRVYNHTQEPMTGVTVLATLPDGMTVEAAGEDGSVNGQTLTWVIDEVAGNGSNQDVTFEAVIDGGVEYVTLAEIAATADQWTDPAAAEPLDIFSGDTVPIWAIQGRGFRSPYVLERVQTEGVVTGVFPGLEGFWLQETDTDDDPRTSAGIFVYYGPAPVAVAVGDRVRVSGQVREAFQQTQITVGGTAGVEVLAEGRALPAPVRVDPPLNGDEAEVYYESLEGMLVAISGPARVVGPTNRYGEFAVVPPGYEGERVWQGENTGPILLVDDGETIGYGDQEEIPYVVATGDTVSNLAGPLAFSFGSYKIEPTAEVRVQRSAVNLPSLDPLPEGQFSLMTWNVENLFDFVDPHPSSPPIPTVREYKTQITKTANTILAAGAPTVIGLQEVENIGVLEDIAGHELLAAYEYQPVLIEGDDSRGIDVGYLVRGDRARVVEQAQYPAPEGITSRPPLLVSVELLGSELVVHVLNNHFTSMSGGEAATEPRRTAQAAWNVSVMEEILAEDPDAHLAVLGDLNSYYDSLPIDALRGAGLNHVFEALDENERYTYIYLGASQVLDHILVTPGLMARLEAVHILHVNADYPIPLPDDTSPLHKSDHDPVVAVFNLP